MYGVEKAVGTKPAFDKKLLLAGDCQNKNMLALQNMSRSQFTAMYESRYILDLAQQAML